MGYAPVTDADGREIGGNVATWKGDRIRQHLMHAFTKEGLLCWEEVIDCEATILGADIAPVRAQRCA